jgi:hypothetical protein
VNVHKDLVNPRQAQLFSGTLDSGWTRIATGPLVLGFIVMHRAITLGGGRRA